MTILKNLFPSSPSFVWSANEDGMAVRFQNSKCFERAKEGRASESDQIAFIRMQMLTECGQAEVRDVDWGIFIAAEDAVRLDQEIRAGFNLPPFWPGGIRLQTESVPQLSGFKVRLGLVDQGGGVFWDWGLRGPILEVGRDEYLPTSAQFVALLACRKWQCNTARDELANLSLLATLREAWNEGCRIDLETYRDTVITHVKELSVDAREESATGDLILRPIVAGDFSALEADKIEERLAQLQLGTECAVLRVGKTIVLLDPTQTTQARAIASRGRVSREQRKVFEKNPQAWLAENVFPDIELDFSPRVTGIGAWKGCYFGANWEEGQDWFGKQPQAEKQNDNQVSESEKEDNAENFDIEDDLSDKPSEPIVTQIITNDIKLEIGRREILPLVIPSDETLGFGWHFPGKTTENEVRYKPDFSRYARVPFSYQKDAVRWLLGHAQRAAKNSQIDQFNGFGAGALFADDMGLGKSFCTLIFLAEWLDLWRNSTGNEPPAVLIVAPLSLLENWKAEIGKSFLPSHSVFTRVLIAQSEGDLSKVRRRPGSRDIAVPGEVKQYGLGFGDKSENSLDYPGSCVLSTYQTLRDYRFSFAKAEWSAVIFDEAQNIKNPNALQTISAKALKAILRLTLTGTPVENHLGDLWSIIDTSEPGPLGSFLDFRRDWIVRMMRDRDQMAEIGQELRDHIGGLMLRRTKEEELQGLPEKIGGSKPIPIDLTPEQVDLYDTVLAAAHPQYNTEENSANDKKVLNRQLAALWQLRQIVLHPDLLGGGNIETVNKPSSARAVLKRSGKLAWLLDCLDNIERHREKVLIFCVQKKLQVALSHHLGQIYGLSIPIINGDTKATSRRSPETTRLGLIENFSNQSGFGVCVLSPIAAGAGLNIVAANHVIHLERHWNPAKEDQATDRVYRIGQERPVTVYLPTTMHPNVISFDSVLHRLLEKKRSLQSAIGLVPPEAASAPEILQEIFGQPTPETKSPRLDLESALKLSWALFEALIATIYEKEAQRIILTPHGSDHGCDVVVLGWGATRENLLIQCKTTSSNELNSEQAIREIEGARPYYENALGVVFDQRVLHTTAQKFSKRTTRAAELCKVRTHGRQWLKRELLNKQINLTDILSRDASRESL